jgi:hypothetical protein
MSNTYHPGLPCAHADSARQDLSRLAAPELLPPFLPMSNLLAGNGICPASNTAGTDSNPGQGRPGFEWVGGLRSTLAASVGD